MSRKKEETDIRLFKPEGLFDTWLKDLYLLYLPMIGNKAVTLYNVLIILASSKETMKWEEAREFAMLDRPSLQRTRKVLERYQLIESWNDQDGNPAAVVLRPPLSCRQLRENELFRRLLFEKAGEDGIERIESMYPPLAIHSEWENVSEVFLVDELDARWSERLEERLKKSFPPPEKVQIRNFRWDVFYRGQDRSLPRILRNLENESKIAHLARIYGVDAERMRKVAVRFVNKEKTKYNFEGVREELKRMATEADGRMNDYGQAPVMFLTNHTPSNSYVQPAEKGLLDEIAVVHGFDNEVINTITEYVLEHNGGAFSIRYYRTLANNMARTQISTRQEALDYLKKPFPGSKNGFAADGKKTEDDWYSQPISTEDASQEEIDSVMKMIEELTGEKNE